MIVTKNSFVGYNLLPGTFSIQLALLTMSIYCLIVYPDIYKNPYFVTTYEGKYFKNE